MTESMIIVTSPFPLQLHYEGGTTMQDASIIAEVVIQEREIIFYGKYVLHTNNTLIYNKGEDVNLHLFTQDISPVFQAAEAAFYE